MRLNAQVAELRLLELASTQLEHLLRTLVVGVDDAELSRALNQLRLRLEDGRKGLIEIGRHLTEVFVVLGLRWQPQRDADLARVVQSLGDFRAGNREGRFPLVILFVGHIM